MVAPHDCLQFSFTDNRRSWRLRPKDKANAAIEEIRAEAAQATPDEAESLLIEALAMAPGHLGARIALAGVYRGRAWPRRAEEELKLVEAIDELESGAHAGAELGDLETARGGFLDVGRVDHDFHRRPSPPLVLDNSYNDYNEEIDCDKYELFYVLTRFGRIVRVVVVF